MSKCDNTKLTIENNSSQQGTVDGIQVKSGTLQNIKPGDTIDPSGELKGKASSNDGSSGDARGQITVSFPYTISTNESGVDTFVLDYRLQQTGSILGTGGGCKVNAGSTGSGTEYRVAVTSKNYRSGKNGYVTWAVDDSN